MFRRECAGAESVPNTTIRLHRSSFGAVAVNGRGEGITTVVATSGAPNYDHDMTPKVGIGITTYLDIGDPEYGGAVFDAYSVVSSKIVPNRIRVWTTKAPVATREDFVRHWLKPAAFERRDDRSGRIIERGVLHFGAEWRRTGSLPGRGRVQFRPDLDSSRSNSIIIESAHSYRVEWISLFERLLEIFSPSYGMLHLFTEEELAKSISVDHFEKFDGPLAGEEHFTSWKSSLGDWRSPDQWEREARRQYRFLPELSWANFLGNEFDGQYDRTLIRENAVNARVIGNGLLFQTTRVLGDVEKFPEQFAAARSKLKQAFLPGFFRR
jgi:hypothetical protein